MQKFSTWMIVCLDVMFWLFRIVATYTEAMGIEFMIKPMNMETEIFLIFICLLAFILIVKRKLTGVIIYIIGYFGYFGVALIIYIEQMNTVGGMIDDYVNVFMCIVGIALPLFTLFDWLLDKNKQLHPRDKKTDWFYRNQKYDMQKDERADKNNYRTM